MSVNVGDTVAGKYRLVELLGESELSQVYLAESGGQRYVARRFWLGHDTALGDEVAASVAESAARLYQSKRPGLPLITECLRWWGQTWLIRVYVQEPTLVELVTRELPSERRARDWGRALCDAFTLLHEQEPPFVFNGLKPSNISFSKLGKIHLLSYPVACFLPEAIQGLYIAPGWVPREQAMGEKPTIASDIYNLGQLVAYMLTGEEVPYDRERLQARRPEVSAELLDVLDRATAEDAGARFGSARDLKSALGDRAAEARKAEVHAPAPPVLTLTPPEIRLTDVPQGETRRVTIVAETNGPDVRVKLQAREPWLFIQRVAFHAARFQIVVVIDTTRFVPGVPRQGLVVLDGDAGRMEIPVEVTTITPPGPLQKFLGKLLGR